MNTSNNKPTFNLFFTSMHISIIKLTICFLPLLLLLILILLLRLLLFEEEEGGGAEVGDVISSSWSLFGTLSVAASKPGENMNMF